MMSLISKLKIVKSALTSIKDLKVYHYRHDGAEAPYCVWAEDNEADNANADNKKIEQALQGTVDFFTKDEFDPFIDKIQEALNDNIGASWRINQIQFEEETNLIHYEWVFEV